MQQAQVKGIARYKLLQRLSESQEGASTPTTMDIPIIVAKVLHHIGVPDTEEIGDHKPVDQDNQSSFGASSGQYGVVLISTYV